MFNIYELYDLHFVLVAIRSQPDFSDNKNIISSIIYALNNRLNNDEPNQIRKALQSVDSIRNSSIYNFVFTENDYTYYPLPYLKNETIYEVLVAAMEEMNCAITDGCQERIVDLADCLHELPLLIAENNYSIPKQFWKKYLKTYRDNWNKNFLLNI